MKGVALHCGIGAMELALMIALEDYECLAYVEIDPYKQSILQARIRDGWLHPAPIHPDVRTYPLVETDIVTSTYPCRWASTASRGRITTQSAWTDVERTIRETLPSYVFTENVAEDPAALSSLHHLGYHTRTLSLDAASLGAPHLRRRVFTLGTHPHPRSKPARPIHEQMALLPEPTTPRRYPWDDPRRDVRVDDGTPYRMAEARAAGDALLPLAAAHALRALALPLQPTLF